MTVLSRDAILMADDLKRRTVSVPEWGGEVIVRTMTGGERDELEGILASRPSATPKERMKDFRAITVALCAVDEQGNRLFTLEDVEALSRKHVAALTRVFDVAQKLSALTDVEIEELTKNSEPSPRDASTSS